MNSKVNCATASSLRAVRDRLPIEREGGVTTKRREILFEVPAKLNAGTRPKAWDVLGGDMHAVHHRGRYMSG